MFRCLAALVIFSWCLVISLVSFIFGSMEYIGWIGITVLSLVLAIYEYRQLGDEVLVIDSEESIIK